MVRFIPRTIARRAPGGKSAPIRGLGTAGKEIQDASPAAIYRFILQAVRDAPPADGLYMPCPQWSICDVIDVAERDTGLPIVAGVTAEFWAAFRVLGIRDEIRGFGRLLASP